MSNSQNNIFQKYPNFFLVCGAIGLATVIIVALLRIAIPLPTSIMIFVFIVIYTTLISMRIRNELHKFLLDRETQKKLFGKIQVPFEKASKSLDVVNTSAMLEKIYAEETFDFYKIKLNCDKWNYFCQILPNLLIAFGLLGTFWGITKNLSGISDILNNVNSQNMIAVENLKVPLQSMGIAFVSSLVALFCSVVITFTNFIWNTNLAKDKLINSIEDYLDNEVFSISQGDTRLSKAVKEMTSKLDNFLIRFHGNVTEVFTRSLNDISEKIIEGNKQTNQSVDQMAQKFSESAGTISRASENFNYSITQTFKPAVKNLSDLSQQVENNLSKQIQEFRDIVSIFQSSAQNFSEASNRIKESRFSENLEELTQNLAQIQSGFTQSTELLTDNIEKLAIHIEAIGENNQKSAEMAEQVYKELRQSSAQWQDGAIVFLDAAEILKESQFSENLVNSTGNLAETHQLFAQTLTEMNLSLNTLKDYSRDFGMLIEQLLNFSNEVKQLSQNSEQLLNANQDKITNEIQLFDNLSHQIIQLSSNIVTNRNRLEQVIIRLGSILNQTVKTSHSSSLKTLEKLQQEVIQLAINIDNQTYSLNQNLRELLQEQTQNLNQETEEALRKIYQYHQSIFDVLQEIQIIQDNHHQETIATKLTVTENLDRNIQNMTISLKTTQQEITNLLSPEKLQITECLNALAQQSETYQLTLKDITTQLNKENNKSKQDMIILYQSIEKAFLNLEEINVKLSRIMEILNKPIYESSTKSNITDIIDKLKGG